MLTTAHSIDPDPVSAGLPGFPGVKRMHPGETLYEVAVAKALGRPENVRPVVQTAIVEKWTAKQVKFKRSEANACTDGEGPIASYSRTAKHADVDATLAAAKARFIADQRSLIRCLQEEIERRSQYITEAGEL